MKRRNAWLLSLLMVLPAAAQTLPPQVRDNPYGASWNGVKYFAPSQNAVYDEINALVVGAITAILADIDAQNPGANEMLYWTAPATSATVTTTAFGRSLLTQADELALAGATQQDRVLDVRWYGAVGDGVTNDTTAVQNTLDAAATAGGATVVLPVGRYMIDAALTIATNVMIRGAERQGAILDFSTATGAFADLCCIRAWGTTPTALPALSLDASGRTVTFASAPTVAAGDVLRFYDPTAGGWNGCRTEYRQGEFATVESVLGSVVTLRERLYDTYASATAAVTRMGSPISVQVENLSVVAKSTVSIGVDFKYNHQSRLSNVSVSGADNVCVRVMESVDVVVRGCLFEMESPLVSSEYGLAIDGSQRVFVDSCYGFSTHHVIKAGGETLVNREIHIRDCVAKLITPAAGGSGIDLHGNSEFSSIEGCTTEGIMVGGNHQRIAANTVTGSRAWIYVREQKGNDFQVLNNTIYNTVSPDSTSYGAGITNIGSSDDMTVYTVLGGDFVIAGNACTYTVVDSSVSIRLSKGTCENLDVRFIVRGNQVRSAAESYTIWVAGLDTYLAQDIVVADNDVIGGGLYIDEAEHIEVSRNRCIDILPTAAYQDHRAIYISCDGASGAYRSVRVAGNLVYNCITTGCSITGNAANKIAEVLVSDNLILEHSRLEHASSGARSALLVSNVERLELRDNVLGSDSTYQAYPVYLAGLGHFSQSGDIYYGLGDPYADVTNDLRRSVTFAIVDDGDWATEAVGVWRAPCDLRITEVEACVMGSASPALSYNVEERGSATINTSGTDLYAADQSADADGETETTFSNADITEGNYLVFTTGAAPETGTVNEIVITVYYY
jgi:polygalacturonase